MGEGADSRSGKDGENNLVTNMTSTPMEDVLCVDTLDVGNGRTVSSNKVISKTLPKFEEIRSCLMDNFCLWVGIVVAALCLLLNWIMMEIVTRHLTDVVMEAGILREDTSAGWTHPRVNAFLSLYLFEIDEPDDDIPTVTEIGPYVYRLHVEKVNVTWHANYSVSYRQRYTTFFQPEVSAGPEFKLPDRLLFITNGSVDPVLNIYTGEDNFSQIYQVYSWNYLRKLTFWGSQVANEIRGTDGSMFPPFLDQRTKMALFCPQLKRTLDLEYSTSKTFKNLPVYRFIIPDSAFSNMTTPSKRTRSEEEDNVVSSDTQVSTAGSSIYNMFPGVDDAPYYISSPHFLAEGPNYHQQVNGLQPQEAKHRSFFDVDTITGRTVNQKQRFQVNLLQQTESFQAYIPLYWLEISTELCDDELTRIRQYKQDFQMVYGIYIFLGVALSLPLVAMVTCLVYKTIKKRTGTNHYVQLTASRGGQCC